MLNFPWEKSSVQYKKLILNISSKKSFNVTNRSYESKGDKTILRTSYREGLERVIFQKKKKTS